MQAGQKRAILIMACVIFVAFGLITSSLGPSLPNLAEQTGSELAALGALFTALFFGSLLTQVVAGSLIDRLGQRPVLLVGLGLMSAGVLGVSFSHILWLTLTFAVLMGLGHGCVNIGTNVMVANVYADRNVSALNLINVFYGLGAVSGPAVASLFLRLWQTAIPALWLGAAVLLVQLPLLILFADIPHIRPDTSAASGASAAAVIYRVPMLWLLATFVLVYVGTETGMGGWTSTYIQRSTALSAETAALITSGFWLALTGGRLVGTIIGSRLAAHIVLLGSLITAIVGGLVLVASSGNAILTIVAVLLLGFGFGPIYPTTVALTTTLFAHGPGKAVSVLGALGSIGGMALPWLQGILLVGTGPSGSVFLVAGCTFAMLALFGSAVVRLAHPPVLLTLDNAQARICR